MHAIATAFSGAARVVALVGAALGLMVFLLSGLIPAIIYGSFAGMSVAHSLVGDVGGSVILTSLEVGGAVISSVLVGALFMSFGAVLGAALNVLVRVLAPLGGELHPPSRASRSQARTVASSDGK
jgi:hypothetical protein